MHPFMRYTLSHLIPNHKHGCNKAGGEVVALSLSITRSGEKLTPPISRTLRILLYPLGINIVFYAMTH